jgi:hypothetical protein
MRKVPLILGLVAVVTAMTSSAEPSTPVATPYFRLDLPGEWAALRTTDPMFYQYRAKGTDESVSVTVLRYAAGAPHVEAQRSLDDFLEVRRKAELSLQAGGGVELSPVKSRSQGSSATASYRGSQPVARRRFLAFAIANALGIVLFYYESIGATAAEFEQRGARVIGKVQLIE